MLLLCLEGLKVVGEFYKLFSLVGANDLPVGTRGKIFLQFFSRYVSL